MPAPDPFQMEHREPAGVSWVSAGIPQRLFSLLGDDVFFVPCECGTKKPLVTYVERPFEATKTQAYRALFEVQDVNLAVYLGKASGGLCAIDFDRDEDLTCISGG